MPDKFEDRFEIIDAPDEDYLPDAPLKHKRRPLIHAPHVKDRLNDAIPAISIPPLAWVAAIGVILLILILTSGQSMGDVAWHDFDTFAIAKDNRVEVYENRELKHELAIDFEYEGVEYSRGHDVVLVFSLEGKYLTALSLVDQYSYRGAGLLIETWDIDSGQLHTLRKVSIHPSTLDKYQDKYQFVSFSGSSYMALYSTSSKYMGGNYELWIDERGYPHSYFVENPRQSILQFHYLNIDNQQAVREIEKDIPVIVEPEPWGVLSPNGRYFAEVRSGNRYGDQIVFWNVMNETEISKFASWQIEIDEIAFNQNATLLAIKYQDGLRVYDPFANTEVANLGDVGEASFMTFIDDEAGTWLYFYNKGAFTRWNLESGAVEQFRL